MDASTRVHEPADDSKIDIFVGWLQFHRDGDEGGDGSDVEQLAEAVGQSSGTTSLGLVGDITEMERVHRGRAIGLAVDLVFVFGD